MDYSSSRDVIIYILLFVDMTFKKGIRKVAHNRKWECWKENHNEHSCCVLCWHTKDTKSYIFILFFCKVEGGDYWELLPTSFHTTHSVIGKVPTVSQILSDWIHLLQAEDRKSMGTDRSQEINGYRQKSGNQWVQTAVRKSIGTDRNQEINGYWQESGYQCVQTKVRK